MVRVKRRQVLRIDPLHLLLGLHRLPGQFVARSSQRTALENLVEGDPIVVLCPPRRHIDLRLDQFGGGLELKVAAQQVIKVRAGVVFVQEPLRLIITEDRTEL